MIPDDEFPSTGTDKTCSPGICGGGTTVFWFKETTGGLRIGAPDIYRPRGGMIYTVIHGYFVWPMLLSSFFVLPVKKQKEFILHDGMSPINITWYCTNYYSKDVRDKEHDWYGYFRSENAYFEVSILTASGREHMLPHSLCPYLFFPLFVDVVFA